nr:hypothetical protein [Apilactobacillus ozensis]
MTKETCYNFIEKTFIKYAKINTRSDENSNKIPSTVGQTHLAKIIYNDLKEMGCGNVVYDEIDGYVVATLPNNSNKDVAPIGFVAHLDTADFPADNIKPLVHRNYDGKDILLNKAKKY